MFKTNNFDLIRLAAALQVAIHHSIGHMRIEHADSLLMRLTSLFPGVPIFFFISGFLISKSFERNPVLKEYALNRILRIYPGLAFCFVVSLAMVWLTGYFATIAAPAGAVLSWVAAQLSIVQFYNPDFMRNYGVGVLNGSLWTITVELQFYVLVPVVYTLFRIQQLSKARSNQVLLAFVAVFLVINIAYGSGAARHAATFWYKLIGVSFMPWFYMFLAGILFQRNCDVLRTYFTGRFLLLLLGYCAAGLAASGLLGWSLGNRLNPLLYVALCFVTFTAAFTRESLSDSLLNRNDVSYGVYVYHMPVVNFLLAMGWSGSSMSLLTAMSATLLLAFVSWRLIEKPALGLKRHPLYQHGRGSPIAVR